MSERLKVKDLVVLVADRNMRAAVEGILSRHASLRIRVVEFDVYVHPEKDPGVLRTAHEFLRPFVRSHGHALALMDRAGSGQEQVARMDLETRVEEALAMSGWGERAAAIVIDPELEAWVWGDSVHVARELGWQDRQPDLRAWLRQQSLLYDESPKPPDPKAAVEAALRAVRKPRSSAIYQALAEKVSLRRCADPSFAKLSRLLHDWFATE